MRSVSGCPASMVRARARSPSISAWPSTTTCTIDGAPFIQHLQDRFHKPQTKALLPLWRNASRRRAHARPGQRKSPVPPWKTCPPSCISRCSSGPATPANIKVAALERLVEEVMDVTTSSNARCAEQTTDGDLGFATTERPPRRRWSDSQDRARDVPNAVPGSQVLLLQHEMASSVRRPARQEMLDIVREKSGKQNIIFIIDEVGQYVGLARQPDPEPRRPGQESQEPG
jgi:hypothetical protein